MSMSDPGYDETDMTPAEFEAIMAEGTPVEVSPGPPSVIVGGLASPFETGSSGSTRCEEVQLAGDQTIRTYRAFADT